MFRNKKKLDLISNLFSFFPLFMFAGDDDLLNNIQTEAITLVDSVLEESVTVVNNNSSQPFNPSSFAQDSSDSMQHDEHQLSHQYSIDDNSYDQLQQQFQLPLINVNNYSINPSEQGLSDEISDNFAMKSDCDIIVKSPTIESMSGKSFEDVDDEYNLSSSALNIVNVESSLNNNTAANITTPPSSPVQSFDADDSEDENVVQTKAHHLVDFVLRESLDVLDNSSSSDDVQGEAENLVENVLQESVDFLAKDDPVAKIKKTTVTFLDSEIASSSQDSPAIVRNISEQKLHRVERKFEHLSSEVRDDDPDSPDFDQIDSLVNKDDISTLQNDFSKISWDESLSATTGDFGSSTPDNDLQDVLNIPGENYRHQHNK